MIVAHKIALDLNNKQRSYMARASGCARFAYNWALKEWQQQYEAWKKDNNLPKPNDYALRRQFNSLKREQFPWMMEVTKNAPQMAIIQLGVAFKNFFSGRSRYPTFRKKGVHDRFTLTNDQIQLQGFKIRIPKLGWVRLREQLRFQGKILSATISRKADRWFVSLSVETDNQESLSENQAIVGLDLGINALATLSTGETIGGVKPYKALLNRLRRLSRRLSRKQKGSSNRYKEKQKLAKLHARISNIRTDHLHKVTTDLIQRFGTFCLEDLHVKGLLKNKHLSRALADQSFFEFRRQLEYKVARYGRQIVIADRWYASSKICHHCGCKIEQLPPNIREWRCSHCGTHHDRDINAAINLKNLAVSSTVSACGEEGSGQCPVTLVKPASKKQEINSIFNQK
ncbi:RNA-guided endonuclease InsQ/TnpB family protein [Bartonella sp. SD1336NMGDW]|uniref:RNA-guided endonuclease InsQ/TnpB family protein n=1 Tax=Bartonella sp. SD1336NMGDW TaxID=3243575 RepID=UPI0035CF088B